MIDARARADRLARLRAAMREAGVTVAALAPTDSLRWLIGFAPLYDERACLLLVSADARVMVMPALNAEQTAAAVPELALVRWADETGPGAALAAALEQLAVPTGVPPVLAVDPEMRAEHLLALQAAADGLGRTIDGTPLLGALRERKDAAELALLAASGEIADRAVGAAFAACVPGASERQVAAAVVRTFREHGCEPEFAIVGAGESSAFPHHETGARTLRAGEPVLVDVGAIREGYHSDITRMAFLGEPSARYREVHDVVEAALAAALSATCPGAACGEVDGAARRVISDAGYGEWFVHRTGHGLGLSGHEGPYVMAGSEVVLATGMVHSIEPGIYLPGEFGVRLEEIVAVTETGWERMSALPRDVRVIT